MKSANEMTKAFLGVVLLVVFTLVGQAGAQTCVQAPSGLVSWLPGDGNANDIADANHGTLQDGATFGTGLVGQAFSFDGTSSVTLNAPPTVPNQGSLTYDLWINVVSYTNGVMGAGDGSYFVDRTAETLPLVNLKAVGDQFAFQVRYDDGTGLGGPIGGNIVLGTWTHVAMVREYGLAFHLYVDGQLVASSPDNGKSLTPHTPKLGQRDSFLSVFVGLIDEFEIFNTALSQAEIQAIFAAGSAGKCRRVPFAAFDAKAEIELGPLANEDEFEVKGAFTLGADSNGIEILTEIVSLEVTGGAGSFSTTIPAGSFEFKPAKPGKKGKPGKPAEFKFEGVIDGVFLEIKITPLGNGSFEFKAEGEGTDLTGMVNPVTVKLTIGDDGGSTTVAAELE